MGPLNLFIGLYIHFSFATLILHPFTIQFHYNLLYSSIWFFGFFFFLFFFFHINLQQSSSSYIFSFSPFLSLYSFIIYISIHFFLIFLSFSSALSFIACALKCAFSVCSPVSLYTFAHSTPEVLISISMLGSLFHNTRPHTHHSFHHILMSLLQDAQKSMCV